MASLNPLLRGRALARRFGPEAVFHGLDIEIHPGELVVLVGPSGCGKTTLLRTLAGLEPPDEGELTCTAPRLGVVFQDHGLCPWWDVAENVRLVLRPLKLSRSEREIRLHHALERVGLWSLRNRLPQALSGGQRQRVALARALAVDAPLWLLDEPFAHLDFQTRLHLQDLLAELWEEGENRGALFVTHDLAEAVRLGDRILVMDGRPARWVETLTLERPRPRPYAELHRDHELAEAVTCLSERLLRRAAVNG